LKRCRGEEQERHIAEMHGHILDHLRGGVNRERTSFQEKPDEQAKAYSTSALESD
jgi:hypothetical protein